MKAEQRSSPIDFSTRSLGVEIMDDLDCSGEVVDQTLRELDFINQWLGGNAVTIDAVKSCWKKIPGDQSISIADLGCGSGEMLRILARLAKKEDRQVVLTGFDANPHIVAYALNQSAGVKNISFSATDVFSKDFQQQQFDFVLATLFTHHFTEEELVILLQKLKQQTTTAIIINDIHRHSLAYYSIKFLTQLFSKSAMVKFDAPLSVLRAFRKSELEEILRKGGLTNYTLTWKWAFRWRLIIFP
jgi:2-polyprenyl-3-methyl-5-hydroxy-6-metoxy-1,4-benzoquinol methylase